LVNTLRNYFGIIIRCGIVEWAFAVSYTQYCVLHFFDEFSFGFYHEINPFRYGYITK